MMDPISSIQDWVIGRTIYTTLTCENNAGLISTLSADWVKISNQPPSIATAVVETMPLSLTECTPQIKHQGVTDNIRLKWTVFADDIGVERFKKQGTVSYISDFFYLGESADDDLFYEVSSDSAQAGVDIIQWQETSNTSKTFGIPASVSATAGLTVHVTVIAVSIGGRSAVKVGQLILP
ncbi:unnamed protein product [Mytilus coruscus]|uniref:Uncharacterized protein n=1 Tax=Mytilus coruscus TaxID=42192 RepID=A0A6J8EAJ8_MYTCO|nr:unnamed protein product [Mytilus coruscus]